MTVVCCWLDESNGRKRITAIADSRASKKVSGQWKPLQQTTQKIFRVRAASYRLDNFDTSLGAWRDPYAVSEIGVAFAGYCFEALTIINLFTRCVEQLVVDAPTESMPEPPLIANLLREITGRYFKGHTDPDQQDVEFLVFGFSLLDQQPWMGKVTHSHANGALLKEWECPLRVDSLFAAGDVGQSLVSQLNKVRNRVAKHAAGLKQKRFTDIFEFDLERAHHHTAVKKYVENSMLQTLDDELRETVGGVLQKAELYLLRNGASHLAFCRDDRQHMLDGLPSVGHRLGYVPVVERMGQ